MIYVIANNSIDIIEAAKVVCLRHEPDRRAVILMRSGGGSSTWISMVEDNDNTEAFRKIKNSIINDRWWKRTIVFI